MSDTNTLSAWQLAVRREAAARLCLPVSAEPDVRLRGAELLTRCLEMLEKPNWGGHDRVAVMLAAELQRQQAHPSISAEVVPHTLHGMKMYDVAMSAVLVDGWTAHAMHRVDQPVRDAARGNTIEWAGRICADSIGRVIADRVAGVALPMLAEVKL